MALNRKLLLLVGVASVLPHAAFAGGREVVSPYVHGGEWEVESKSVYVIDDDNDVDGTFEQAFEVGYGVTDRVKLAAGIEFEKEPNEDTETKAVELEAKVQLTEKDAYYVDSGFKFVYEYSTTGDNDEIKAELLLAKSYGDFSHGANIEVGTEVGDDTEDRGEWSLAWKSKYKLHENFNPGFEYYGEFGDFTEDTDDQEHFLGPVAYGEVTHHLEYDAGVLFGITDASPDAVLKANFHYHF